MNIPVSYLMGAKISFGDLAELDPNSQYFIYECDEYDRNFLQFNPYLSLISGIDWDHPDIYPTRESYLEAFNEFVQQSEHTILWHNDAEQLGLDAANNFTIIDDSNPAIEQIKLVGLVNRKNGLLVTTAGEKLNESGVNLFEIINRFPGLSRRFEEIVPNVY